MRVKICGITSLTDALVAIEAGVNALGFVFYKPSPRYITPEQALDIIKKLPPFVEKVALFVNETPEFINTTCHTIGATLAQIHFEVDENFFDTLTIPYLKVVRAQKKEDVLLYQDEYRLVDAYSTAYGGVGKQLNLEWFDGVDCSKIILAGGLDAEILDSVKNYNFYAVDVSSGVESAPGKKEKEKIEKFIAYAR
ncbi:MAG: phosphoribosylanthranilate isomerase [Sulfurimonadaceae bacterium]|jgi:phosphoribosylanthranilate isomerase|nr:phosphoribosylanthranilate isomerase [Sulfurimonadaceae bacterium]